MIDYQLRDPSQVLTPCLLVYPQQILANIAESIRIAGSADRLRPHVKTHKTPEIVKLTLAAGITKHKCATLSEAMMLAQCGAPDVLVAYPQVGPAIAKLASLASEFPQTQFSTVVDDARSLEQLEAAFQQRGLKLPVYLDIDTGMHRTGVPVGGDAVELYRRLCSSSSIAPAGLHVYDGQNHQSDISQRQAAVDSLIQPVLSMVAALKRLDLPVPSVVCGGTPTFPVFAGRDWPDSETRFEYSPGTCILWDYNYGRDYADLSDIAPALVLMTRVISRQHHDRLTVDLGYKAVAADPPAGHRCHFLGAVGCTELQHSEEHLVLASPEAARFQVGDVLYALPAHVCPTVALHSHLLVVEDGAVVDRWKVVARDRLQ